MTVIKSKSVKYLLVQTAVGDYRQGVVSKIKGEVNDDFKIICGKRYFDTSTVTRIDIDNNVEIISNSFFFNRKILFQLSAIIPAIKSQRLILEMNPRIISGWIILLIRLLLNKKTVLWGHAWPRQGRLAKSDRLRNILRSLGSHILVYTDTQKKELHERMPNKGISSAPNALYSKNDMWAEDKARNNFIYVGRLVYKKKPKLMIEAFKKFASLYSDSKLIIVGDGPEREKCELLVKELQIEDRVSFLGHISDLEQLRQLYSECIASLSPGYVGLSITQSFSFGTPMLVSDDEPHSPEIEAAVENQNCLFFKSNNVNDMYLKLQCFYEKKNKWKLEEQSIILDCQNRYSTELMSSRILEAFNICQS